MTTPEPGRLTTAKNAWLATVRADGRPHLTPIWFVFLDDRFWFCTNDGAVKAANLRTNPKVAVSLEDGNQPVVAEGTAALHARPFAPAIVDAFMAKFGWDLTRTDDPDGDFGTLIEVVVDRWLMGGPDPDAT